MIGAAIGAGLGAIGGLLSKGPDYGPVLKLFDKQQGRVNPYMNMQLGEFRKALEELQSGYGQAENSLTRSYDAARGGALRRGQQLGGALTQNALTRGLYRTSALGQGLRGIGAQTEGELGGLQGQLAAALAGLQTQKAQALAGGRYQIGNIYPSWLDRKNQISSNKASALMQALGQQSSPFQNAIGGAFGGAMLGSLFTGGAGAAAGGGAGGWPYPAGTFG